MTENSYHDSFIVPLEVVPGFRPIPNLRFPGMLHKPLDSFSIAVGSLDAILPIGKVESMEANLRTELGNDEGHLYEIKTYKDCGHGFSVRADPKKAVEDDAAEQGAEQAASWFKEYLT